MTKSSRALCAALAVAVALSIPGPAFSETIVRKTYSYFSISGKTAADLDQQLSRHGPLTRNTGARHPGATEIKFGGELTYVEKNGLCSVGTAKVVLNTRILPPHHGGTGLHLGYAACRYQAPRGTARRNRPHSRPFARKAVDRASPPEKL